MAISDRSEFKLIILKIKKGFGFVFFLKKFQSKFMESSAKLA